MTLTMAKAVKQYGPARVVITASRPECAVSLVEEERKAGGKLTGKFTAVAGTREGSSIFEFLSPIPSGTRITGIDPRKSYHTIEIEEEFRKSAETRRAADAKNRAKEFQQMLKDRAAAMEGREFQGMIGSTPIRLRLTKGKLVLVEADEVLVKLFAASA